MNEVIKVSLAGIAFSVDKEGYAVLERYLDKLQSIYKGNPDGVEIIRDIEARIAELILALQTNDAVVSETTVTGIIEQLGLPEQEPVSIETTTENPQTTFPRRLYRNPEGRKLGGVCSGLGKYFEIEPVWIRLGMFSPVILLIILPTIGFHYLNGFLGSLFGAFVLVYFLLWFSLPLARTPRQVLEMNGEPVTAKKIDAVARTERTVPEEAYRRSDSVFSEIFTFLGRILLIFMKVLLIFIGFTFAVSAISIGAALISVAVSGINGSNELLYILFDGLNGITAQWFVVLILFNILVPMVIFIYLIVSLVFRLEINKPLMWTLAGIWLITMLYGSSIAISNRDKIWDNAHDIREWTESDVSRKRFRFTLIENSTERIGNVNEINFGLWK